ncbi:MAG: tetratricopeptide repeat protein, partial [candidate division Zixibacteria bacterium]|nr:tetratricopeptide repeat protein [candidate division Zixibacteria bacterium]
IRDKFFWPSSVKSKPDPRVADITTHSKEAYRYYLDGLDYKYKWYLDEAEQCFRQAVNLDSTFAMCYYYLSTYGTISEQLKMIKTAAQYLGQVTRKEGYYINSRLHWLLGDTLEAINQLVSITENYPQEKEAYYQLSIYKYARGLFSESNENAGKAIQIDPFYKVAYNQLAYGYLKLNDYDSALNTIDKYIALAPEEANPYDSKAEIYLHMRKPLEAVEAYEKAVELKPDFYNSLRQLGRLYLSLGMYDKAVTNLQKLVASSNVNYRISGVLGKAYVLIFQGKFGKALESLDSSIVAIRYDSNPVHADLIEAYAHFMKSKMYEERGQFGPALDEINQYIRVYKKVFPKDKILHEYFRVYIMAASGDMETAKGIARELKYNADNVNSNYYDYYMALGSVAFFEKDFTSAIKAFKQASKEYTTFQSYYLIGRTYLEMNQPEKAIEVFQNLDFIYAAWGTYNCLWDAKMRYYWGCACDDAKKYDEAKSLLKDFVWHWQNADFEPEEITDAKNRLARLKEI